ncbi:hypothetical protein, partial [Lonepinella sp. BR2357]|uniref:hypothetical protein n=1 Tax=Lonepinella sp. BR2357 TaxID=3434549 RepID=UPI003F6E02B2
KDITINGTDGNELLIDVSDAEHTIDLGSNQFKDNGKVNYKSSNVMQAAELKDGKLHVFVKPTTPPEDESEPSKDDDQTAGTEPSKDDNQTAGTEPSKDDSQTVGTEPSKDDSQTAGTEPSKDDSQTAGTEPSKDDSQTAGTEPSKNDSQTAGTEPSKD